MVGVSHCFTKEAAVRHILTVSFVLISVLIGAAVPASAQSGMLKLGIHVDREVGADGGVGVAAWGMVPQANKAPGKWLLVAGPRYKAAKWWVEFMAGAILVDDASVPLVDVRFNVDTWSAVNIWGNVELIIPRHGPRSVYLFLEANRKVADWLLIGVETENDLFVPAEDALSIGPHIVIPGERINLILAYQFHPSKEGGQKASDQIWARMIFKF